MPNPKPTWRNPWAWVSTLYLAEGLPYVVVMTVAVVMYKGLGISNTEIALYTSWLYLPWVIKPLWSPIVDILKTRRTWIWAVQLILGAGLAGVALTLHTSHVFQYSLAFLWLLAFSSATHDIAIDGFYLLATTEKEQAFFVGIRSTFYRISMVFGQGVLVILAGLIQDHTGLPKVELRIEAKSGIALIQSVVPETNFAKPLEGELLVVTDPASIQIAPAPRPKAEVKALLESVKNYNAEHGFYDQASGSRAAPARSAAATSSSPTNSSVAANLPATASQDVSRSADNASNAAASKSWWSFYVADPLAEFLRTNFGPESKAKSDVVGNIGLVTLHLSKPPGREVVVTLGSRVGFGFKSDDDKSFSVAEGTRFVFNDQNWNQPALAAIQVDPKQKNSAASVMEIRSGNLPLAWAVTFFLLAGMFLVFSIYHRLFLPYPVADKPGTTHSLATFWQEFFRTFGAFFKKDQIGRLLLFLLFYRFAEAQLVKMVVPFLLDAREAGGLALTTSQVGFVYGTVGILGLTCGGLLGGMLAAKNGLKYWLWWMVLAIHLPDAVFVYLAYTLPDNFWVINACVAIEQFGYGFGFTAYMLYMIYIARGQHATAHYAICTGFMALGMLVPGMVSGWLEDIIGYQHFFLWVLLATIPGFLVVKLIPLDADFGKKE